MVEGGIQKRRLRLVLIAFLAIGALCLAAAVRAEAKPTVVLVHGAWDRPASWSVVATRLRADGYRVVVADNPLRGLAGDTAAIRSLLDSISGPIVLVGHSFGGAVVTNAAAGQGRVVALVYVAAFVPEQGESLAKLGTRDLGSMIPLSIYAVPYVDSSGVGLNIFINPLLFPIVFAADVPPATAAAMARSQKPITFKAFTDPSGQPAWRTIPSWYMVARQDRAIPPATERFMAQRAHAQTVEIDSSHAALVSRPVAVANLVVAAATATAG